MIGGVIMAQFIDMTGWIMSEHGVPDSRFTIIQRAEDYVSPKGAHIPQWLCECSCEQHTKCIVKSGDIRSGKILSCGCVHKERVSNLLKERHKNHPKLNVYSEKMIDEHGEYYIGYTSNTNEEFYFDANDFDEIKKYCWYKYEADDGYCTLVAKIKGTEKHIKMTALLDCMYYDHIDRNTLNNRRYNLREATFEENGRNKSLSVRNNSGVTGVYYRRDTNRWRAEIMVNYKNKSLGSFINKDDAIIARLKAEEKYYAEFAPQRHLFEQYGITQQND